MIFTATNFEGVWLIEPELNQDERGFFARTWCQSEFGNRGLAANLLQCSVSFNHHRGTLRGMHYQIAPHEEAKVVRCTRGGIFDVIVDVRPNSPTYGHWQGFELTCENHLSLYIPEGFAHGFQTLADNTEVFYQIDQYFAPQSARGFHHADSEVGIRWPLEVRVISAADQARQPLRLHITLCEGATLR